MQINGLTWFCTSVGPLLSRRTSMLLDESGRGLYVSAQTERRLLTRLIYEYFVNATAFCLKDVSAPDT